MFPHQRTKLVQVLRIHLTVIQKNITVVEEKKKISRTLLVYRNKITNRVLEIYFTLQLSKRTSQSSMRKNRFQGLSWYIETKLPIASLKFISPYSYPKEHPMHRRKEIDFKDSFGLWYIETKLPITNRVLEIYFPLQLSKKI